LVADTAWTVGPGGYEVRPGKSPQGARRSHCVERRRPLRSAQERTAMATYERTESALPGYRDADIVAGFLRGVYGWMCGGLLITAAFAWLVSNSPALTATIFGNRAVFWILVLAQLGIVFTLSARVDRMASSTAAALFIVYSALTGVTLSAILLLFTGES